MATNTGQGQIASLSSLAALKAIFRLAAISITWPVPGLRPVRAGRSRTCRMPRPVNRTFSPALSRVVTSATRELSTASLCCLVRLFVSANSGASCLSVTVAGVGALAAAAGCLVAEAEADALAGGLGFLAAEGEVVGTIALAESVAVARSVQS